MVTPSFVLAEHPLTEAEIEFIEHDHDKYGLQEKIHQALRKWQNQEQAKVVPHDAVQGLRHFGRKEEADQLEGHLQKIYEKETLPVR